MPVQVDVRALAILGVVWAAFGLFAAVLFTTLAAPVIGDDVIIELTGKGGYSSLELATNALSVIQVVGAAGAVVACAIIAVVAKRATAASVGVPALVSILTPLLIALVSVNVLSPVGTDGRALSALVGMVIGAAVGGGSFAIAVFLTRPEAPVRP
jgi:hypothetical protein